MDTRHASTPRPPAPRAGPRCLRRLHRLPGSAHADPRQPVPPPPAMSPSSAFPWQDGVTWQTGEAGFHGTNDAIDFFPPDTPLGGTCTARGIPTGRSRSRVLDPRLGRGHRHRDRQRLRPARPRQRLDLPLLPPDRAPGRRRRSIVAGHAPRPPINAGRVHHRPSRPLLGAGPERRDDPQRQPLRHPGDRRCPSNQWIPRPATSIH